MPAVAQLDTLQLCTVEDDFMSSGVPSLQRDVQVVKYARARNAKNIDRGNVLVTHTFTVSRGHADVAAAAAYLKDLPRAVGRAFGVFIIDDGLGGPITTLNNACATFQAQPAKGLRTSVVFTVTGSLPNDIA